MDILFLFLALLFTFLAIGLEVYFLYAMIISRNCKYPPAFPSFGKMKEISLREAERILSQKDKGMKVADLGCGTATLLAPLAKKFPKHQFVGFDWDWVVCQISNWRCRKLKNVSIKKANFLKENLDDFDLFLCFLDTKAIEELSVVLPQKIKKNSSVISSAYALKGIEPSAVYDAKSYGMPLKVFVYEKNGNNL